MFFTCKNPWDHQYGAKNEDPNEATNDWFKGFSLGEPVLTKPSLNDVSMGSVGYFFSGLQKDGISFQVFIPRPTTVLPRFFSKCPSGQWIGLGEILQETPIFNGKNPWVSCEFSLKPIH